MYYHALMITVHEICLALGRREMEAALGVSKASISNAVSNGVFPASWYDVIESECKKHDLPCDRSLFNFKKTNFDKERGAA